MILKNLFLIATLLISSSAFGKKEYTLTTLPNKMDVISFESHKVPLVTIALTVKAGAMTESASINGLTHLWEHMFFKGNKNLPTQDLYLKKVRQLGISFNGSTSAEKVNYYFTLPSVFLEEGIEFMAHAIQSPLIDEKELKKERGVVLNEYQRSASSPAFDSRNLTRHIIYGDAEHQRDPLGLVSVITTATREQLLKIKDDVFVPANSLLIIGGDFDSKKIPGLVKKYFGNWKNPKNWKRPEGKVFPVFPKTQKIVITNKQISTPSIKHIFKGPKAKLQAKDSFAADVLISLLNLKSGRFYKDYIDSGKTLHSGLGYYTQSQAGEIVLYASTKAVQVKKVYKNLLNEPKKWIRDGYFTQSQLDDVRRSLLIDHKRALNKPSDYVKGTIGFWWAVTGMDYYDSYLDNLRKTTLKDVQNFVKKYLINTNHLSVVLLSPTDAKMIGLKDNSKPLIKKYLGAYKKTTSNKGS